MPTYLAWGSNILFQKGYRPHNQYLVANWLPCYAPWAWSFSHSSDWENSQWLERSNPLCGVFPHSRAELSWNRWVYWAFLKSENGVLVFFYILFQQAQVNRNSELQIHQKRFNFPSESRNQEICSECLRIITCHRRGKATAQTAAFELGYFTPALIRCPWRNRSMQSILVWWYTNLVCRL